MRIKYAGLSVRERVYTRIDTSGEHWMWIGSVISSGYGAVYYEGKMQLVHRVSLKLEGVDVPDDCLVCHHCDIKLCVRPSCLYVGTAQTNSDDQVKRGRSRNQHSGQTHCGSCGLEYGVYVFPDGRTKKRCWPCHYKSQQAATERRKAKRLGLLSS